MSALAANYIGDIAAALDAPRPQVMACFIGRELAKGRTKTDIARSLGKSTPWVAQHAALLSLPAPIAKAVEQGRTADVTLINELAKAYRADPLRVVAWLKYADHSISREAVRLLREQAEPGTPTKKEGVGGRPFKRRPMLFVVHGRQKGCIILNRLPSETGRVWIRYDQDGREVEVPVSEVKLIGLST